MSQQLISGYLIYLNICGYKNFMCTKLDNGIDRLYSIYKVKGEILVVDFSRNQPVYNISVAAELVGVHPRTLRIYEEVGLIVPARTEGNTRLFSNADIEALQHIRFLIQDKGLNLAGVKLILLVEEKLSIRIEEWCE
jgi:MerR family transcriptional regulator/heat shock protein HspR